ncbi:MAG: nucleotide exchange factor GrpE [Polyangiales bacterium]
MSTEETEKVGEAAGEGAAAEGNGAGAQQTAQESPPDPVAVITAERDKMKDQLLRALADFDNFRKRSRRDIDDAKKRGQEEVLRELLPVFDNLERASNYARSATDTRAIAEGVEMVSKLFLDTLARLGGRRVVSVGAPFDPNVHEALQQVDSDEHAAGIVVQEHVSAYEYGGRLLRPAMVVVSKGPGPGAKADEPLAVDAEVVNEDAGGESAN